MSTDQQQHTSPVRLVVVDDHEFAREAVAATLDVEPDLSIVGLAGTVADAKTVIDEAEPDVAVLDLNLPDGSGHELVEYFTINQPRMLCVVYTSSLSRGERDGLIEMGAAAVILKTLRGTELLDTIRQLTHQRQGVTDSVAPTSDWPWS